MSLISWLAILAIPIGFLLERFRLLPFTWKRGLSQSLIRVFYPSLIFGTLTVRLDENMLLKLWPLPLLGAGTLMVGYMMGNILCPRSSLFSQPAKRSFRFIAMLPNYSYLPLLLADVLWGSEGMMYVMLFGVGADLFLWSQGVSLLQPQRWKGLERWRMIANPPLFALGSAILLHQPELEALLKTLLPAAEAIRSFGTLTLPLSMLLLGFAMAQPSLVHAHKDAQARLLTWRLLISPGLAWLALSFIPHLPQAAKGVALLIASMPGAIVSVVLSEVGEGDPAFAAQHVLLGHLLWLLTGGGVILINWTD